jgi:tungstate transport system ATP-binding protein
MSLAFEAHRLALDYGGRRVLDLPHLALSSGRTLACLGPNGAGKSTLLRLLALLEPPTRGELLLLGEPVGRSERQRLALRRRMATVFQAPLLTRQSVAKNVALGLRFRGVTGEAAGRRVGQWLERLGIAHLAGRPARSLSGGEAQRASLARALVLEPELLLLDEPFASLDPDGREALALELEAILREARIAAVLVTHDRHEALLVADEVAVLMEGRLAQLGPLREAFAHPADAQVARFLGVENLLPALVTARGGVSGAGGAVLLGAASFRVALPADALPGEKVLLCVRAEEVHLAPAHAVAVPGNLWLRARVERVVPYGVPYRVYLDAGVPVIALAARHTIEHLRISPGADLLVSLDPASVHAVREPG